MRWVSLSYTLPSGESSSPRVALWRRLRRLGAVSPTGGLYLLPAMEDSIEAFTWLAEEIRAARGQAYVGLIEAFAEEGADGTLIEMFREVRDEEYAELAIRAAEAEKEIDGSAPVNADHHQGLSRLQKRFQEIERLDFFGAPHRREAEIALERLTKRIAGDSVSAAAEARRLEVADYRDRRWVTRPRPHVDRLACAWFIRRFLDPDARIRYGQDPRPDELAFDMPGAPFGHHGRCCSLETMMAAFGLDDPALVVLAKVVHEIDLRDGTSARPEVEGVEAILKGWRVAGFSDAELEEHGVALFEGLYGGLASGARQAGKDQSGRI